MDIDRYVMNFVYWVVFVGEKFILEFFMKYGCDLIEFIYLYKENIVLFVCMGKSLVVCKFVGLNKNILYFLYEKNREGWSFI